MNGTVDDQLRALLDVEVYAAEGESETTITVWIDTAFNGGLTIPHSVIEQLELQEASSTPAILADGQIVNLTTFTCCLRWFGRVYRTQVVESDGELPLLGTMLLDQRVLLVDYKRQEVSVL